MLFLKNKETLYSTKPSKGQRPISVGLLECHYFFNQKKASTITEVLIVLGIISVTVIVAVNVIIKTLVEIKSNEIDETANAIMLEAMEVAKSPAAVLISDDDITRAGLGSSLYYTLSKEGGEKFLKQVQNPELTECGASSDYYYNLEDSPSKKSSFCLQVIITKAGEERYQVVSKVVYNSSGEDRFNFIRGTRYNDYVIQE